jgi:hypothetical protein
MGSLVRRCAFVLVGAVMCATLWGIAPLPASAAPLTVTNCNDSGAGSLRDAITTAVSGDAIGFTPGLNCSSTGLGPIAVASTLTITQSLTIDGIGATIVLDGGCIGCGPGGTPTGGVQIFKVNSSGTMTFGDLTIQHANTPSIGGAIAIATGTVTVHDCVLSGNNAGNGAAISVAAGTGIAMVRNDLILGNRTTGVGGAIINSGPTIVMGTTFDGNAAPINGGAFNNQPGSTALISNSTFANNTSGGLGGALSNLGTMTLTNVTIAGNTGSTGGGIATGNNNATLTNTIVANSTGGALSPTPGFNGTNNLVDDAAVTAGGFTDGTNGNIVGHPALLGTLGNYGGTTQTIPLLPGSPALDAGAAVGAGPAASPVPATDQRGKPRVGTPDMGAFESQGFTLTPAAGSTPQSAFVNTAFAQPLALTVTAVNAVEPVVGGQVTFTPPASGPSAVIAGSPATLAAGGTASATATANGIKGAYTVAASVTASGAPGASFALTNTVPLVSIAVAPSPVTLKVGQQQQFTATGTFADNSTADLTTQVTWTSDAPNMVSVDATGNGTAKSAGSAHITATQGAVSGQATVTVGTPVLTGAQPAPAPPGRQGGTASQPGSGSPPPSPAPVPAPSGR